MGIPKVSGAILIAGVTLALAACDNIESPRWPPGPPPPAAVVAFVAAESLPDVHHMVAHLELPGRDLLFFRVWFGPPHDCPAGCFYDTADGLMLGTRIGWLDVRYGVWPADRWRFFDVAASDSALFAPDTWLAVERRDSWLFWSVFLRQLARDPDTSGGALGAIALLLYDRITPWLGNALLDNPAIGEHPEVLQTLACLPAVGGADYDRVRRRARELLGDRFTACRE